MSKIESRGAEPTDTSDWNHAWNVIAQLAAARGTALRELEKDADIRAPEPERAPQVSQAQHDIDPPLDPQRAYAELVDSMHDADPIATPVTRFGSVAADQLARDMAEIERAAAALRRDEPELEPQSEVPRPAAEIRLSHSSHSVWFLVGVIWLTAVAVVSCAVGTVALLLI
jgi:hypothetical protein